VETEKKGIKTTGGIIIIMKAALREWTFYAVFFLPLVQNGLIGSLEFDSTNDLLARTGCMVAIASAVYFFLIYRMSLRIFGGVRMLSFFIRLGKHALKLAAVYVSACIIFFLAYAAAFSDSNREGEAVLHVFPVSLFCLLYFVSNYGVSSIIITGSSSRSIISVFKHFLSGYTVYNLVFISAVVLIGIAAEYLPDRGLPAAVMRYSASAAIYSIVPMAVIFLTRYALMTDLFSAGTAPGQS
jgi:hypothetical protein